MELAEFVLDFALGLRSADARNPVAINQRSKEAFKPGIGPHAESAATALVMAELAQARPSLYQRHALNVPYATGRKKCDVCLGEMPDWEWAIEVKLLRFLGDNGQPNDNILMHILSPYPAHRSALTDCEKLLASGLAGRKAILIYGFDSEEWPLEPAIAAFETLANARIPISSLCKARFVGLVHPIHSSGQVFAWEIQGASPAVP